MIKAKILVVEDEVIIGMEIKQNLQNLGYEVTSIVDTGDDAINKAEQDKPDLILMDIRIQGDKDGIDTAEEIRNKFGIPVIFSTAYLDQERIERAKITMPFGYVLKPIQERDLKVTLEMALYVAKVDAERKKAEEIVKKKERQLAESQRVAKLGGWIWYIESDTLEWTDETCRRFDQNPETFKPSFEYFTDRIHPNDKEKIQIAINETIKNDTTYYVQGRIINETGREWVMEAFGVVDRDKEGNPISLTGTAQDITERKHVENELLKQKMLLENAESLTNTGAWEWNIIEDKWMFSHQWLKIHGCKNTNLSSEELLTIAHPGDREMIDKAFEEAVNNHKSYDIEHRIIRQNDGVERIVKAYGEVLKDSDGKAITLYGAAQDITDQKKSEEKLIQSEDLLREVINNMEKAIAVYEPINDGDDFKFIDTNEFAEQIMHFKKEDVIGKTIKELFPGEPSVGLIEKLKETYLTGNSTHIPLKQYQDDRITQFVENYIFKLPSGKVVAMFEDTTAKRKAEE